MHAASGIVGHIVFICTRQYSSAFLASGSTISFAKFLSAVVCEYPYRRVLLSVLFVPHPSRSVAKLFHTAHHLTSCDSQGKFRRSHVYHGPFLVLPHHPQRLTRPEIRLLPCTFSHVVTAVSAFPLWHARFSDRRGHPVTDTWSRDLRGLSCPSPVSSVRMMVKLSPVPVWSIRMFHLVVEFFPSSRIINHFRHSRRFVTFLYKATPLVFVRVFPLSASRTSSHLSR